MSKKKPIYKQLLLQLTSGLLSLIVLLPTPSRANTLLGIIRDDGNTDEWNNIITRIRNLGISYEPIDLRQINTVADLSGVKVIFLPNIETLTETQVDIIEEWVKQGGKLIASGQVGRKSKPGVRQELRSLLGSYWAFPLSQPAIPEARYRCLDIACKKSTSWAPMGNDQDTVEGGVLIPAGLSSTTAATWKGSSGSSAVVITPQATYFGWNWGSSTSATLDSAWLQAVLNRYQSQPQFTARNNNPLPTANSSPTAPITPSTNPVKIRPRISSAPPRTEKTNPVRVQPRTAAVNTNQPSTTTQNSTENTNQVRVQPRTAPVNSNINQPSTTTQNSTENRDQVKVQPQTAPVNSNINQPPTTTQNSTTAQDNIWLRSQQQQTTTEQKPPQPDQASGKLGSQNNNLTSQTSTVPKSNNVWNRFREQIDRQNQQAENISTKESVVNSLENSSSETANNRDNIWNRARQQTKQQNQPTENISTKETNNPTSETSNNRGNIWNRSRQQTTTSSSRRNPLAAILRPLPPPEVQVPNSQTDPSSTSAPAGLEVRQGNYPISRAEANAMLQELNNLLGRFESALVAAKSANVEVNLSADKGSLVATNSDRSTFIAQRNREISDAQQIVERARLTIQRFPQQVASKQYATARSQWLQTRQMLWQNYPTDGERAGAEIRAVWLDRGTIVRARSERGLAMVFDRLAAAGINTVFFETLNAGYTIYPSNVAPRQNPLTTSWDPLESAVKLARERNMEIHAWIWTFATGNKAHNRALGQPDSYLGPVISAHPNWVMTDNKGRKRHPSDGKVYMDPANPYVRQYLLKIIDEIASRYQVDGIQLDYIRYPFQNPGRNFSYGYSTTARQQFQRLHGVDPMKISSRGRQNRWKWTEFKINQVNSFVADTSKFLKQKYPRMILSAAVFPFPRHERFDKIQQDWESWVLRGDIDLLTPMTYALDTNRFQQITQPLTSTRVLGSTLITPAVKLLNLPEIVAVDQIQAARDLPTGGYIIFAAERITGGLHGFLTRTQGGPETGKNNRASLSTFANPSHVVEGIIPYRQPFVAAADRFQALKKEWSFLLANEKLSIRQSELESWGVKAEELAADLNQLAENPDNSNLNQARNSLRRFQLQFRGSMGVHARENAYQVQTWQNRLAALEMLLNYGERVRLKSGRF
ncbi:family 10 glycosylhydrolase [Okeania sp. SIO2B3]|uniref:family 10 glycosylhydrolase n=1 Tax=Okeania sp. SIO2B3 TaxID=2607784 RepID=UPI0025F019A5|nr:family 10 glycosylhydrolase [Okeania sp. SIO2B3]